MATEHLIHNLSIANATAATSCETDSDMTSVAIGIGMGVIGSILINIGQNFQAAGLQSSPRAKDNPCSSRVWVMGLTIFITGSLLNFGAFTFASASVLVPIEAIQFVVNVAFNKYVNKKPISCRMVAGVCLTVAGTVVCVVFGPSDARCFTLDDIAAFWTIPLWWAYVAVTIAIATAAYMTHESYARAVKSGANPRHQQYVMPVTYAVSSGTNQPPRRLPTCLRNPRTHIGLPPAPHDHPLVRTAALFGGSQMIVHSKAIAELMELQVRARRQSTRTHPCVSLHPSSTPPCMRVRTGATGRALSAAALVLLARAPHPRSNWNLLDASDESGT